MKLFRVLYYLSIAGLLFAGLYTGRREVFLLLFILVIAGIYALFLTIWTIQTFSYTQELSAQSAVKGASAALNISIYNDKPFPFTMMRIRVQTVKYGEDAVLSFNLSPKSRISFEVPLFCAYRGVYPVGMTMIEINDIFGLHRITYDMRKLSYYRQKELTVYPKLPPLAFLPAMVRDAKLSGGGTIRVSEDGEAFSELRPYREGDPSKRIHWKASAGKRELLVRRFDVPAENSVMIAVDCSQNVFKDEEALMWADIACEYAAAIARISLWAGYSVCLMDCAPHTSELKCSDRRDFAKIYDRLALMPFGGDGDIAGAVQLGLRGGEAYKAIYVVTARTDDKLCGELEAITREGFGIKCVMPGLSREPVQSAGAKMPGVSCSGIAFGEDVTRLLEDEGV